MGSKSVTLTSKSQSLPPQFFVAPVLCCLRANCHSPRCKLANCFLKRPLPHGEKNTLPVARRCVPSPPPLLLIDFLTVQVLFWYVQKRPSLFLTQCSVQVCAFSHVTCSTISSPPSFPTLLTWCSLMMQPVKNMFAILFRIFSLMPTMLSRDTGQEKNNEKHFHTLGDFPT